MPVVIMPVSVVTVNRATVSSPDFCDSRIVFVHATAGHVTLGTLIQHACDIVHDATAQRTPDLGTRGPADADHAEHCRGAAPTRCSPSPARSPITLTRAARSC